MKQLGRAGLVLISALSAVTASGAEWEVRPGELPSLIGSLGSDKELILKGTANASDLTAIRRLPAGVERLDMSLLEIKGDTLEEGDYFGYREFVDGEIPPYMAYCTNLKSVTLPRTLRQIGTSAFASTPLAEVDCGKVSCLGSNVFRDCRTLRKVELSNSSISEIPEGAFDGCSMLESLVLPDGINRVGAFALRGTAIKNICLPSVSSIGDFSFAMTPALTSITLPVKCHVGTGAFYGASALMRLDGDMMDIPDLTATGADLSADSILMRGPEIGSGAFAGSGVTMAVLSGTVERIGALAFADMKRLQKMDVTDLADRTPEVSDNSFSGTQISRVRLYVLNGTEDVWKNAPVWKEFDIAGRGAGITHPESAADPGIVITRDGRYLRVRSSVPIDEVGLYGADGRVFGVYSPGVPEFSVEPDMDGEILIIRVVSGGMTRIAKLMTWEKTN